MTPPSLAETRIDESPDFYTLGTGNVLTHGTFKHILTVPTALTVGHILK